jgi:hypothetical protein
LKCHFSKMYKRTRCTSDCFHVLTFSKMYKYMSKNFINLYICTLVHLVRLSEKYSFTANALVQLVRFLYISEVSSCQY